MEKEKKEIFLYDWTNTHLIKKRRKKGEKGPTTELAPIDLRWKRLRNVNKVVASKEDLGLIRSQGYLGRYDILFVLYQKKQLTGQALKDAEGLYKNLILK